MLVNPLDGKKWGTPDEGKNRMPSNTRFLNEYIALMSLFVEEYNRAGRRLIHAASRYIQGSTAAVDTPIL